MVKPTHSGSLSSLDFPIQKYLTRTDLLSVRLLCKSPPIQYAHIVPAQCSGSGFALWSAVTV